MFCWVCLLATAVMFTGCTSKENPTGLPQPTPMGTPVQVGHPGSN